MTMCAYLMEMQQYYRWENGIPYSMNLKKNEVGAWLAEREKFWNEIENLPYSPLPIGEEFDPFEAETVNRRIIPGFGLRVRPRPHRPACSSSERDHLSAQGGNLPHVWEKTGLWKKNDTADPKTALERWLRRKARRSFCTSSGKEWLESCSAAAGKTCWHRLQSGKKCSFGAFETCLRTAFQHCPS